MSQLRIFSYLPNPRVWKATIAARLCGIDVEVRGVSPKELAAWLWDFDARPLSPDELAESSDVHVGKVGLSGTRLRPLGPPLTGHTGFVRSVVFSPDGKTLASGSEDDTLILWDVASRQPLGPPLTGHIATVTSVAFSPDGKTLASGSGDKTVLLWDMAS